MSDEEIPYEALEKSLSLFLRLFLTWVISRRARKDILTPDLRNTQTNVWELPPDLDLFFTRFYRYWKGHGFYSNLLHAILNLVALLFMILFSAFLLFAVNWSFLRTDCTNAGNCRLSSLLYQHPLQSHRITFWTLLKLLYLVVFLIFWSGSLLLCINESISSWHTKEFCRIKLGISEDQVKWISWSELVHRLVLIQSTTRLCLQRGLNEMDIINRIMRKENYFIGMINKGVLCLTLPFPGFKRRHFLTKTLEWNVYWGLLNPMFDERFEIKENYRSNVDFLKNRFRYLAVGNLLLAPFLFFFLMIYFVMMNAEKLYHSPSTFLERTWSLYACWRLREFNEMEHQLEARRTLSLKPARDYLNQFPNYSLMHVGKLLSFVFGSFMALLLCTALLNDSLFEGGGEILGHNLIWWTAILMTGLNLARGLVPHGLQEDPELCLADTIKYTHYCPKAWRGHAKTKEVKESFEKMFQYRASNFFDELASLILGPYILHYLLASNAELIVQFLQNYSTRTEGVGDTCSLASFDFSRHGNVNYGSPFHVAKWQQSHQGKMEKSFLSFFQTYPSWKPDSRGREMLKNLDPFLHCPLHKEVKQVNPHVEMKSSGERSTTRKQAQGSSYIELPQQSFRSRLQNSSTDVASSTSQAREEASLHHNGFTGSKAVEERPSSCHAALESFYLSRSRTMVTVDKRNAQNGSI